MDVLAVRQEEIVRPREQQPLRPPPGGRRRVDGERERDSDERFGGTGTGEGGSGRRLHRPRCDRGSFRGGTRRGGEEGTAAAVARGRRQSSSQMPAPRAGVGALPERETSVVAAQRRPRREEEVEEVEEDFPFIAPRVATLTRRRRPARQEDAEQVFFPSQEHSSTAVDQRRPPQLQERAGVSGSGGDDRHRSPAQPRLRRWERVRGDDADDANRLGGRDSGSAAYSAYASGLSSAVAGRRQETSRRSGRRWQLRRAEERDGRQTTAAAMTMAIGRSRRDPSLQRGMCDDEYEYGDDDGAESCSLVTSSIIEGRCRLEGADGPEESEYESEPEPEFASGRVIYSLPSPQQRRRDSTRKRTLPTNNNDEDNYDDDDDGYKYDGVRARESLTGLEQNRRPRPRRRRTPVSAPQLRRRRREEGAHEYSAGSEDRPTRRRKTPTLTRDDGFGTILQGRRGGLPSRRLYNNDAGDALLVARGSRKDGPYGSESGSEYEYEYERARRRPEHRKGKSDPHDLAKDDVKEEPYVITRKRSTAGSAESPRRRWRETTSRVTGRQGPSLMGAREDDGSDAAATGGLQRQSRFPPRGYGSDDGDSLAAVARAGGGADGDRSSDPDSDGAYRSGERRRGRKKGRDCHPVRLLIGNDLKLATERVPRVARRSGGDAPRGRLEVEAAADATADLSWNSSSSPEANEDDDDERSNSDGSVHLGVSKGRFEKDHLDALRHRRREALKHPTGGVTADVGLKERRVVRKRVDGKDANNSSTPGKKRRYSRVIVPISEPIRPTGRPRIDENASAMEPASSFSPPRRSLGRPRKERLTAAIEPPPASSLLNSLSGRPRKEGHAVVREPTSASSRPRRPRGRHRKDGHAAVREPPSVSSPPINLRGQPRKEGHAVVREPTSESSQPSRLRGRPRKDGHAAASERPSDPYPPIRASGRPRIDECVAVTSMREPALASTPPGRAAGRSKKDWYPAAREPPSASYSGGAELGDNHFDEDASPPNKGGWKCLRCDLTMPSSKVQCAECKSWKDQKRPFRKQAEESRQREILAVEPPLGAAATTVLRSYSKDLIDDGYSPSSLVGSGGDSETGGCNHGAPGYRCPEDLEKVQGQQSSPSRISLSRGDGFAQSPRVPTRRRHYPIDTTGDIAVNQYVKAEAVADSTPPPL